MRLAEPEVVSPRARRDSKWVRTTPIWRREQRGAKRASSEKLGEEWARSEAREEPEEIAPQTEPNKMFFSAAVTSLDIAVTVAGSVEAEIEGSKSLQLPSG